MRLDSGELLSLSRGARALLDEAEMRDAQIVASGDLEEHQIAKLVAAGAPIDIWGVGTELGTSRDAPALGGVYKLVADAVPGGSGWRPVWKRSPAKATIPGPKQVFRSFAAGTMTGDLVAEASEHRPGRPLLERFIEQGRLMRREPLAALRTRAINNLAPCRQSFATSTRRPPSHTPSHIRSCCFRSGHSGRWACLNLRGIHARPASSSPSA